MIVRKSGRTAAYAHLNEISRMLFAPCEEEEIMYEMSRLTIAEHLKKKITDKVHEEIDADRKLDARTVGICLGITHNVIDEMMEDEEEQNMDCLSDAELRKAAMQEAIEFLTDAEQRIFLAAMDREKKWCKQVDDEWPDSSQNLVHICEEIERKVKRTLWTI